MNARNLGVVAILLVAGACRWTSRHEEAESPPDAVVAGIEQRVARLEAADNALQRRACADDLVTYLSSVVAAGRGYFHAGEVVRLPAQERQRLTSRVKLIGDSESDSYYLRTTLLHALSFLDNEMSADTALSWLKAIGSDLAPLGVDKELALTALARHVVVVRDHRGLEQLRCLVASKDWPDGSGEARDAITRTICKMGVQLVT